MPLEPIFEENTGLLYSIREDDENALRVLLKDSLENEDDFDINQQVGFTKQSLLHITVKNRSLQSTTILLESGANPLSLNHHGKIPRDLLPSRSTNLWRAKDTAIEDLLIQYEQEYYERDYRRIGSILDNETGNELT